MAEKRMLSKVISVSEKVNFKLKDNFQMLLFTWMIPHADDFGRLPGSPAKVKALVIPMLNNPKSDVEQALQYMHDAELINWYEVDGDKYIEIVNFEEHQSGLHKRTKSKIPDPQEVPGNSGKFQEIHGSRVRAELNRTELKGTEENRTELNRTESDKEKISHYIDTNKMECRGAVELEDIYFYLHYMTVDLILNALMRCTKVPKVVYAKTILIEWKTKGYTTLEEMVEGENHAKSQGNHEGSYTGGTRGNAKTSGNIPSISDDELDEIQRCQSMQAVP